MIEYLPIFTLFVLAMIFAVLSLVASALLRPDRPTAAKEAPYECGIVPTREPPERFPVRFYLIAMIFIVFDIEIIFLYPWAVISGQLGLFGLIQMAVFALIVFESLPYLISNGALEWGPTRRLTRSPRDDIPTDRTSDSTVRRIGRAPEAA